MSNNYPPLSFWLVGRIGTLAGDHIIAGRFVSLASFALMILGIYVWVRASGTRRLVACAGAVLLAAAFAVAAPGYIAMNDPQMLAHAFMLTAVALLWRFDFSPGAVVAAAALVLLGGFTKHLLIPLPLAITAWLGARHPQRLLTWVACLVAGALFGIWVSAASYAHFIDALLMKRTYDVDRILPGVRPVLRWMLPLLLTGAFALVGRWRRRESARTAAGVSFVLLYLVLSLTLGAIVVGGAGVSRNAFFDLYIACVMFAALGLEALWALEWRLPLLKMPVAAIVMVALGGGMVVYAATHASQTSRSLADAGDLERDTRTMVALVEKFGKGGAACETLAICYWAGQRFTIDFFSYGQKLKTGVVPIESCEGKFERREFPIVQVESDSEGANTRLGACTPAIRRNYIEVFRSRLGILLVPKPPATGR